jgi:5-(aminomethyl)-3-furanmethanol phosphate kinase
MNQNQSNSHRRVIKLGGSLLTLSDMPTRFLNWFERQAPAENLLIVGGGVLVESLRNIDKQFSLTLELSHKLAIQMMDLNATWVAQILGQLPVVNQWPLIANEAKSGIVLLTLAPLLNQIEDESRAKNIPVPEHSWNVTSDSLAAWLAALWPADELVLLKSCLPKANSDNLADWVAQGYVDAHFNIWQSWQKQIRAVDLLQGDSIEIKVVTCH